LKPSGLIIVLGNVIIGASPDGTGNDYVAEIKFATSEKTKRRYI
jgi:hypothetical protein